MANGWTDDDAVQEQIQDSINDEVLRARKNVPCGESLEFCEEYRLPVDRLCPVSAYAFIVRKKQTKNKKPSACTIAAAAKTASCVKIHNQSLLYLSTRQGSLFSVL